jgi:hypothetical protein
MSVVALRQDLAAAGSTNGASIAVASSLLALHARTALLGPQLSADWISCARAILSAGVGQPRPFVAADQSPCRKHGVLF